MECVAPPQLNDSQLLAYIDGDAADSVTAHLAGCPACRERARQLGRLMGRMTVMLYRLDCPTSIDLGEYQLGLLPEVNSGIIAAHLTECPHCRAEIMQLQGFLVDTAPEPQPGLVTRVRVLVARLLSGRNMPGPALTPGLAGVRGGDAPLVYEADDLQITLSVEWDQATNQHSLFGLILGAELPDAQVHLWRAQRLAGETKVDEFGNFVIMDLEAATYELVITGAELEVHLPDVGI
jgi:hypothetical protein